MARSVTHGGARVILLTRDDARSRAVAAAIHERVPLSAIILEEPRPTSVRRRVRRALMRSPAWSWIERALAYRRPALDRRIAAIERQLSRNAEQVFRAGAAGRLEFPAGVQQRRTPSVNSPQIEAFLRESPPDLLLVFGTGILRGPILSLARLGVLNAHASLLPRYRGTSVELWQVLNGDLDAAGITIHFVNDGVDTGDVVHQRPTSVERGTDHFVLRARNVLAVMDDFGATAAKVLDGTAQRRPQPPSSERTWRSRDVTIAVKEACYRKLGYLP